MRIEREIAAEMLLEYLFPEAESKWKVSCKGSFYRNYNNDSLSYDSETYNVDLSRNGFLKLLPDSIYTDKNELREGKGSLKDRHEKMKWRESLLSEAFSPLDSIAFRQRLAIERNVSELLNDRFDNILGEYFGFDSGERLDPFVRKAAAFLPGLHEKRGDPYAVRLMLASILEYDVELDLSHRYSERESCWVWLPMAIYTIRVSHLSAEEFSKMEESIKPLTEFIREWFLPFDLFFKIQIREEGGIRNSSGKAAILNYNSELR